MPEFKSFMEEQLRKNGLNGFDITEYKPDIEGYTLFSVTFNGKSKINVRVCRQILDDFESGNNELIRELATIIREISKYHKQDVTIRRYWKLCYDEKGRIIFSEEVAPPYVQSFGYIR
jgi:hypothetical protein